MSWELDDFEDFLEIKFEINGVTLSQSDSMYSSSSKLLRSPS